MNLQWATKAIVIILHLRKAAPYILDRKGFAVGIERGEL